MSEKPGTNAKPDALRVMGRLLSAGVGLRPTAVREALDLCANAWEQERAENLAKDKRIRELERIRELADAYYDDPDDSSLGSGPSLGRALKVYAETYPPTPAPKEGGVT